MADTQPAPSPKASTHKGATVKIAKKGVRKPTVSSSQKANLKFSVARTRKYIKKGNYAPRISAEVPVYVAGVVEYLVAEVLELTGNSAIDNKRKRIGGRDIMLAVRNDEELNKFAGKAVYSSAGVIPSMHIQLLPAAKQREMRDIQAGRKKAPVKKPRAPKKKVDEPASEAPVDASESN